MGVNAEQLRALIRESLQRQGFRVQGGQILPPHLLDKDKLRQLHAEATSHRVDRSKAGLFKYEPKLLRRMAAGGEVVPELIMPRLVEVQPDSEDELLFRYATLHWSIPVSSGYGRRIRFLVIDQQNDKLLGVFGLGDPVFTITGRDLWVGWSKADRAERLHHVMDAFVLGAVPPYSLLLCGKLVAMLVASNEVREAVRRKYAERRSLILDRTLQGELALVTTTSALGRSSIYNRLKFGERLLYHSVGFTRGSGEFHFSNGLYSAISAFAVSNCEPTAKHDLWGTGFRSRREIVRKTLAKVGLPEDWLYHGIQREIFVVPLAQNIKCFLRGEDSQLAWYDQPADDLFAWFRERWLLPRSRWDEQYRNWTPEAWKLWSTGNSHG